MPLTDESYVTALVKRAQKQDSDAFAELYAMTYEGQYRFACKYLHDPDDAWDAVQEVFVLAFKKLTMLQNPRCIKTWLTQINARVCADLYKQRTRYVLAGEPEQDGALLERLPDHDVFGDPELSLLRDADNAAVRGAVARLPEKERAAIRLRYYKSLSLQDVAGEMGCSISSVTRYVSQGLKRIRAQLEREKV